MRKIFKYEVWSTIVNLPVNAQVITIEVQNNTLCVWAIVDPNEKRMSPELIIIGTGHAIPPQAGKFIKTIFQLDGRLVWHVFKYAERLIPTPLIETE